MIVTAVHVERIRAPICTTLCGTKRWPAACYPCTMYPIRYIFIFSTLESSRLRLAIGITIRKIIMLHYFQLRLMRDIRTSIVEQRFPDFIKEFMLRHYQDEPVPKWIKDALQAVNVHL